jgi:signal transduction histidine kinase
VVALLRAADDFENLQGYRERVIDSQPAAENAPSRRTNELVARILAIPPLVTDIALAGALVLEALTNTLRHAHASEAWVTIAYSPHSLALQIADNGIGRSENGPVILGHGLDGMRERAALFGGTLTVGPNPGRGYLVRAELPL